jgi:hypothetical protein
MARAWLSDSHSHSHSHGHGHDHGNGNAHKSEVECLSITLTSGTNGEAGVDLGKLEALLKSAPKDEVYRIKAVLYATGSPKNADGGVVNAAAKDRSRYILNWSFGRWTWSRDEIREEGAPVLRMSIFTAPYESTKWTKKVESGLFIALDGGATDVTLVVKRVQ